MVAELTKSHNEPGQPDQRKACSAGQGGCGHCREVVRQLSCGHGPSHAVPIKEVLLVFLLPLVCAAAVVILVVHCWPTLAGHPGYLALAALVVACGALAMARTLIRKNNHRAEANQTQK